MTRIKNNSNKQVKYPLNLHRLGMGKINTNGNYYYQFIFNFRLDYSYGELFAVSIIDGDCNIVRAVCKNIPKGKEHKCGRHYASVQPKKSLRLDNKAWTNRVNDLLKSVKYHVPKKTIIKIEEKAIILPKGVDQVS